MTSPDWHARKAALFELAAQLGLHMAAVTTPAPAASYPRYKQWLQAGYHGEMGYLARPDRLARREDLRVILPDVHSVLIFSLPYWPGHFPPLQDDPRHGNVSCYAWGRDYHKILGKQLKALCRWLASTYEANTRWYVDTGAIQERDLAERAGLGFIGKNTLLIHPQYGSGFFLGEILCSLPFPPDPTPTMPSCGSCTRCLDACPTRAFVAPYLLDARLCISYLTIELKGSIPTALRPLIGNKIYGCDICQQVCPWNKFAGDGDSPLWGSPSASVATPALLDLIQLDDEAFLRRFEGSPIRRLKRERLLRNVTVALGNTHDPAVIPALQDAQQDPSPLIQEHARWAIEHIHQHATTKDPQSAL